MACDRQDDRSTEREAAPPNTTAAAGSADTAADGSAAAKDPDEWVTGGESMTGPQASYLRTLSQEAGVEFDEGLTKAEASKRIDELQEQTGRGRDH